METMKAVQFHEYGGVEVLRLEDAPRPAPGAGEVLVRVRAAGVNPVDAKMRAGMRKGELPQVAGLDFAGVVEEVGAGVDRFAIGDEVYGRPKAGAGSYAQFVVAKASEIAHKPKTVELAVAAALPTAALTAWQALFESRGKPTMDLQRGQTVVIVGASGGVGTFAVQLARWKGAKVIASASGDNADYVRELGADVFVDYKRQRLEHVARDVDAALDVIGADSQRALLPLVKKGGVLVSTVGIHVEDEARERGVRTVAIMAASDAHILEEIARLVDEGALKVPVSEELPFEEAKTAHRHIESGHTRGKIVLDVH